MSSRSSEAPPRATGFRLGWWYALVFSASAVALVGITYLLLAVTLRQYDREIIQTTLVQLASAYARGGVDGLAREIQRAQSAGAAGPLLVRTLGSRRDVVYLSVPDGWGQFDLSQLATPALTGEQEWATVDAGVDGEATLEVASVRLADGTLFQVGKSTERRSELLRRFRRVLLLNLALILLIGLAGGAVLTRSALEPVRSLAATVRDILRTGRTTARVPVPREAEDALGELSVLVNAMLDRIDAVVSGMRGALDNVGHDLRTPMARLRGTAEAALASEDPAVLREALAACLEESEEIMAMLNTLMDISEAETGAMTLRLETVSLRELVSQAIDLYEDLAEHQGIRLDAAVADDVTVEVDRIRMRQALANLVDNAIKYTPAGGRVEVAAGPAGETHVVLSVSDTGMGIPPEEIPHIWSRLYRGDKSRTSRGLGLGLSLVKAIVEAHGGEAAVTSTVGAGSRFEIRLPRRANLSRL
jgi:signal transduction histidine kinase